MNSEIKPDTPGSIGRLLQTNKSAKVAELALFCIIPTLLIMAFSPMGKDNLILSQAIAWTANVIMLGLIWAGLKLRGGGWKDLGLSFSYKGFVPGIRIFLLSLLVFVLAISGFVVGSVIMANITGIPNAAADLNGYDYLRGNIGMLFLSLAGVLFISSFGEEVIYRGFLVTRIAELDFTSKRGTIIAVIVSSVAFGLVHYAWGVVGIVQTGFMGLALGFCYVLMKRRLIITILAHAYMDTILMVQMYSNVN